MNDFASSMMERLLLAGTGQAGVSAHVPLGRKRELIAAVVARSGHAALLDIGAGIRHLAGTPLYQALAGVPDPHTFMQRWQRLERYMHSRHRLAVLASAPDSLRLLHHAPGHDTAPLPGESLLVLGVIVEGLRAAGALDLRVRIGEAIVLGQGAAAAAEIERLALANAVGTWDIAWCSAAPRDIQADAAIRDALQGMAWPPLARRIAEYLLLDLAAGHTLGSVALYLGMSTRSLQRALAQDGMALSKVIAETRGRAAAWWLCNRDEPVAQVGFLCGYADQAHFTREFTRMAGVAPARYQRATQPAGAAGQGATPG